MSHCTQNALLKYAKQTPRYTSYPTAPHFYAMKPHTYHEWLATIPAEKSLSLYLHVPYCKKLCWFCGCQTRITQRYDAVSDYLMPLMKEISMVASAASRMPSVSHLHFGGGSPTILHPDDFSHLMEHIRTHYTMAPDAELAIEVDPRGLNEAKIAAYAKHGINRISLGVQDFDREVQEAVNRVQPVRLIYDAMRMSRDYGITSINMDLIYGLPKQTVDSLSHTIDQALMFSPDRIALFGYAHVPWKKRNIRLIEEDELPDDNTRQAMFSAAAMQLTANGYVMIGLDHFAKASDPLAAALKHHTLRRNFQGYTTDHASTLIGFGASAIGSFEQGYVQNTAAIEAYDAAINAGKFATVRGIALTDDDKIRRRIIEQLMCYLEVDLQKIEGFSALPREHFAEELASLTPMMRDGLITIQKTLIRVNPSYPQAVRLICAAFDAYYHDNVQRHSQVS